MAYYSYKRVLKLLPKANIEAYDTDGYGISNDYDGDLYHAAADYIESLHKTIEKFESVMREINEKSPTNP